MSSHQAEAGRNWEPVARDQEARATTARLRVPGGHIYRMLSSDDYPEICAVFVPEPPLALTPHDFQRSPERANDVLPPDARCTKSAGATATRRSRALPRRPRGST